MSFWLSSVNPRARRPYEEEEVEGAAAVAMYESSSDNSACKARRWKVEQTLNLCLSLLAFNPLKPECDLIPFKFLLCNPTFRHYSKVQYTENHKFTTSEDVESQAAMFEVPPAVQARTRLA